MRLDDAGLKTLLEDPRLRPPRALRGCSDESVLRRVLLDEASESERLAFVDHLVECADCAGEYRAARSLAGWSDEAAASLGGTPTVAPALAPSEPMPATAMKSRRPPMWLVAAAVLIAAAGVVVLARRPAPQPESSSERGAVEIVMTAVSPADGARLSSAPTRLEWQALLGATSYEVSIYDAESSPIWKSPRVTGTSVDIPASVTPSLVSGHSYLWRVVARTGLETRPSSVHGFSVGS